MHVALQLGAPPVSLRRTQAGRRDVGAQGLGHTRKGCLVRCAQRSPWPLGPPWLLPGGEALALRVWVGAWASREGVLQAGLTRTQGRLTPQALLEGEVPPLAIPRAHPMLAACPTRPPPIGGFSVGQCWPGAAGAAQGGAGEAVAVCNSPQCRSWRHMWCKAV